MKLLFLTRKNFSSNLLIVPFNNSLEKKQMKGETNEMGPPARY